MLSTKIRNAFATIGRAAALSGPLPAAASVAAPIRTLGTTTRPVAAQQTTAALQAGSVDTPGYDDPKDQNPAD